MTFKGLFSDLVEDENDYEYEKKKVSTVCYDRRETTNWLTQHQQALICLHPSANFDHEVGYIRIDHVTHASQK